MTLPPMVEIKHRLVGPTQQFQGVRLTPVNETDSVVLLHRLAQSARVEHIQLPAGTLTLGHYWRDRPYNVYHWFSPAGVFLGLYINISDRTRIEPGRVEWRDLVLDLLYAPDGHCQVLDEDELPDTLDPDLRGFIQGVRDRLLASMAEIVRESEARSTPLLERLLAAESG